MDFFIEFSKIYVPMIIVLLGIVKIYMTSKKKADDNMSTLINNVLEHSGKTDTLIAECTRSNEVLSSRLDITLASLNKQLNPVIIDNDNSANIIKSAIFTIQCNHWVKSMKKIYIENGLEKTERTLKKIESKTLNIMHATDQELRQIDGMGNYITDFSKFVEDVRDTKLFGSTLDVMIEAKIHNDNNKLDRELNSLYNIVLQELSEKYSF